MLKKPELKKDLVLESWLNEFLNGHTQNTYRSALNKFKKLLEISDLETYLNNKPDAYADIKRFLAKMNGKPPKTVKSYASAVKLFLGEKGFKVTDEQWKKLTRRGYIPRRARATTQDKAPSKEILRRILTHSNIKLRALVLFLVSSGCRIGETLQLEKQHFNLEANPPRAKIPAEFTKGGVGGRTVYFSYEARDAITEWLKVKDQWKKRYRTGTHAGKRVFPWTSQTAGFMLRLACDKAELNQKDSKTDRRIYHLHGMRKFFRTKSGLGLDTVNALMGHEEYLDASYLRLDETREIAEEYLKAMPNLSVFNVEDKSLVKKTAKLEEEKEELKQRVKELEYKNEDFEQLRKQVSIMAKELDRLLKN